MIFTPNFKTAKGMRNYYMYSRVSPTSYYKEVKDRAIAIEIMNGTYEQFNFISISCFPNQEILKDYEVCFGRKRRDTSFN